MLGASADQTVLKNRAGPEGMFHTWASKGCILIAFLGMKKGGEKLVHSGQLVVEQGAGKAAFPGRA